MIASYLTDPVTNVWMREAMPLLVVPDAIDETTAADLRVRLDVAGASAYRLADRGRYRVNRELRVDALWAELGAVAASIAGAPVELAAACWLRFGRGDYSLVKDDIRTRAPGRRVEIVLDLSVDMSGEAEVVYADGERTLVVPQIPRMLAVVDRSPTSTRYQRPPTVRGLGGNEIIRLIMQY